jgi:methionine-rich copper-binding protein CopC
MPTYTGTTGNDSWNLITPGTFTLDGLAGTDTLNLGTSLRSSYNITQATDGSVHIDSISGASGALHATLYNMEVLTFNSTKDVLVLSTLFPTADTTPPTVSSFSPAAQSTGVVASANIVLTFSEAIQKGVGSITLTTAAGATVATYDAASSANLSISGSTLTINPSADLASGTTYTVSFTAGSIKDLAGNAYTGSSSYGFTTAVQALPGSATTGNDSFTALPGHYTLDGLGGTDTLNLGQALSAYTVSKTSTGFTLSASDGSGIYDLVNVERLAFSDGKGIALDLGTSQSAGETELLLGAVLGKTLLAQKTPLIGAVIGLFDQGFSLQQLSGALMRLPIWDVLTGHTAASNADIASYLLTTVNHAAPDAATLAAAVSALNSQTGAAQGTFLATLAETAANQVQVDLVGLANTGLIYG